MNVDDIPFGLSYNDVLLIPRRSRVESRKLVNTDTTLFKGITLSIPLITANMDTVTEAPMAIAIAREGGFGTLHRFMGIEDEAEEVKKVKDAPASVSSDIKSKKPAVDRKGKLLVGASIGIKGDYIDRANALVKAGADMLILDVAHGHSDSAIGAIKMVKKQISEVPLMAGNVATAEAVEDLAAAGADSIKIGIGPGEVCTTRKITGAGMPQFTAVMDCCEAAKSLGVSMIADGGIRESGDITKALAAGADAVMIGSLFAGTDESPGYFVRRNGAKYKAYRGSSSFGANMSRRRLDKVAIDPQDVFDIVPEGVESSVPYKGSVKEIANQLVGGVRSGMSYCGAMNLAELRKNARFIRLTQGSAAESFEKLKELG